MTAGELAVLDAHVHLWDPAQLDYPWLDELPLLRREFGPAELDRDTSEVPLEGLIFVECNCRGEQALPEARAVAALAESDSRWRGIVAFADLTRPDRLDEVLNDYRGLELVRGIRHNIQGNPPGFCLRDDFIEGVRETGRRGFTFDLCATHDQLDDVVELCRRCPGTRLVLDHCGKPDIAHRRLDPWRGQIEELASLPHVWCKLSGLMTETGEAGWQEDLLLPFARHVVEQFGRGRVMYGGDWPVLTLAGTYREWYEFTRRFTRDWSAEERSGFYRENAFRFYGIQAGTRDG